MGELIVGRPALLIIDMQHDFLDIDAVTPAPGAEAIIPRVAEVADAARAAGVPVIYTQETHRRGRVDSGRELDPGAGAYLTGGDPLAPVPEHCVEGTPGNEIVRELAPHAGDLHIVKRRYSCFIGTDLDLLLRNLDVQTLLITGVDSNVCVLWTVGHAFQLDYHVRVIEDCVAGTSPGEHEASLLIMRNLTAYPRINSVDVRLAFQSLRLDERDLV
jgi:nicotinamidase-related amidase